MKRPFAVKLTLAAAVMAAASGLTVSFTASAADCGGVTLTRCPAPFDKTLPDTKNMLTWSQADRVVGFRNDYRNYRGDVFHHGEARPLANADKPLGAVNYKVNGQTWTLDDYLQRQNVAGMLVLKRRQGCL